MNKSAVLPLVVAGGLVAAVAVAIAGDDDAPQPDQVAATDAEGEGATEQAEIPTRHKSVLCRKLRCTVDQDQPVYELIIDHREAAKAHAKTASTVRRTLAGLYAADELDDAAMRGAYGEIAEAEGKIQLHAYESLVTLHALLSPEQREILGAMLTRVPPQDIFAKPGGGEGARTGGKARARRGNGSAPADPEARAARAEAMRARRAASGADAQRGGARRDAAARRRAAADAPAADEGGLQ